MGLPTENKAQAGFGIIEALVAAIILSFIMFAVVQIQVNNRKFMIKTRQRDEATRIARELLHTLQYQGLKTVTDGNNIVNVNNANLNKDFFVNWTITPYDQTFAGQQVGRQVNIVVSWDSPILPAQQESISMNGVLE
jgi:Tfp pilus assembly protein PilV